MLLEEIWSPFPWKYHVCFRHWYREHHTAAWSSEIWAVEAGRWLCMASASAGPAVSQEPICLTVPKCHPWKSKFKANLSKPSISSRATCFHETLQCLQNSTPSVHCIFPPLRLAPCSCSEQQEQWQGHCAPDEWSELSTATLNGREHEAGSLCCPHPF